MSYNVAGLRELVAKWRMFAQGSRDHLNNPRPRTSRDMTVENECHMRDMDMCANELEILLEQALAGEGERLSAYQCANGHSFSAICHSKFDMAPHHCPECGNTALAALASPTGEQGDEQ